MFILVPVAAPEPVRQPQHVQSYAPNPATGYGQPPAAPHNVLPFRRPETCQLVRQGVDRFGRPADWYSDFLEGVPDLDPSQVQGRLGFDVTGLVPSEADQRLLQQVHHPADVSDRNPNAVASADPGADAYGSRGVAPMRSAPYLVTGGGGSDPGAA